MIRWDFHVHSSFSDGADSPEALAEAALDRGLTHLGISDHSYTAFDTAYCVPRERLGERHRAIAALKVRYRGRLAIYEGIEQDIWSGLPAEGYDYVIGSVHYLRLDGRYYAVDESPEMLDALAEGRFGGDYYALAEAYFDTVARVAEETGCGIIGHFDLIAKFNEKQPRFDPRHPRYVLAWQTAGERLLRSGKPLEINTGAMSRDWTSSPYPEEDMLVWLAARGASFVLSSDSHSAGALCCDFARQERRAQSLGLKLLTPEQLGLF